MLCLTIDRPRAIAGLDEAALLDPGYSPEGDWPGAPALGLGFALRLVRNLAEAVGGALAIEEARFALHLPAECGIGSGRAGRRLGLKRRRFAALPSVRRHAMAGGACSSTVEPAAHNG